MQFLSSSLDNLSKNITNFPNLSTHFPDPLHQQLLTKKGVFPYDYLNSHERFADTSLPSKQEFHNQLYEQDISDQSYEHAQNIWNTFECETMLNYHDIYLKTDVLLLADIFEQFRSMGLEYYNLDPVHYYSLPGYSWDAALKFTGVQIELINVPLPPKLITFSVR